MATRFGGVPKGVVPVLEGSPEAFLWVKLRQLQRLSDELGARIPVILMHSFATEAASRDYLQHIDWAGIPSDMRHEFSQSVMPGTPMTCWYLQMSSLQIS